VTSRKLTDRLADLEARAKFGLGREAAESIVKQLSEAEKSILVSQYVHGAYGKVPGWDFSHLAEDYSRVSARIAGLKEAANGC
jgi:hypothetical protein